MSSKQCAGPDGENRESGLNGPKNPKNTEVLHKTMLDTPDQKSDMSGLAIWETLLQKYDRGNQWN